MERKKTIFAALSIALVLLMTSSVLSQTVHHSGVPKVDDIYYKAYPGALPETVVNEFCAGETDWMGGPSISALHDQVVDAGHIISEMDPMAEFTFFPFNCRDYKETSGEPNAPMNDSSFRIALSYVYGVDDKQTDVFNYYGVGWQYAIWNPVPDAQLPWYNASIRMPDTDFDEAWNTLSAAGYTNDTDWLQKDGVDVRAGGDIVCLYPTGATFYPDGPLGGLANNWNAFLAEIGVNGPQMTVAPTDFSTLVTELMFTRNYDIIGIGLTNLGIYVDWIYDLSHSDNAGPWGWNFAGIVDTDFDTWGEIILTDMVVDNVIAAASDWQEKFVYELMPWMPVRAGLEFCTTANDTRGKLENVIPMDNYGPSNDYSWMCLHWNDGIGGRTWPGDSYIRALGDEPHSMNPYDEDTLYGWQFLDRAIIGLCGRNPVTLKLMPMVANNWTVDHWTSIPELGITDGSTATFFMRQDVTWQDGYPVTAYDCVYNMRTMRVYEPGRYSGSWAHLVYEEADGPYKFNVYFDSTSLYHADNVAGTALLAPQHIIEAVEQQVEDGELDHFFDWNPSFSNYEDLMDVAPPAEYPWMKQIVGCGPFVFDYYDRETAVGHVAKYEDFFVSAPVIGSVWGEWRIDPDTAFTYQPVVQNFGAKTDTAEGECTNMTVDVLVYVDDILNYTVNDINLDPWDWTYLGPYTTVPMPIGLHTVKVEVYDAEDDSLIHTYVHEFVATIREDVNTYTGELLDFTVDMRDVGRAARAFGSYPGHLRWDPACDVNDDYEVDMRDIGAIARKFGWPA
jgi:ABC-type transport system substrate-binding protein